MLFLINLISLLSLLTNSIIRDNNIVETRSLGEKRLKVKTLKIPKQDNTERNLRNMPHLINKLSKKTIEKVIEQLNFVPFNLVDVGYYNSYDNSPVVLKLYPLNLNKVYGNNVLKNQIIKLPFPTMYWMSCPDLIKKVYSLEVNGFIQIFNDRLHNSPETPSWLKQMEQAHQLYREERWKLLTPEDQIEIRDRKL